MCSGHKNRAPTGCGKDGVLYVVSSCGRNSKPCGDAMGSDKSHGPRSFVVLWDLICSETHEVFTDVTLGVLSYSTVKVDRCSIYHPVTNGSNHTVVDCPPDVYL